MTSLRAFVLRHRAFAAVLIALALAMKALVPAGTMIAPHAHLLTVQICDGYGPADRAVAHAVVIPVAKQGAYRDDGGKVAHHAPACPYSALGLAGLGGADPVLLALALVFILAVARTWPAGRAPRAQAFLRPPLRAPPAQA
jgi:hypothetical protein